MKAEEPCDVAAGYMSHLSRPGLLFLYADHLTMNEISQNHGCLGIPAALWIILVVGQWAFRFPCAAFGVMAAFTGIYGESSLNSFCLEECSGLRRGSAADDIDIDIDIDVAPPVARTTGRRPSRLCGELLTPVGI
jgi:hypothetical protein